MARNQTSKFLVADGLFNNIQDVQEVKQDSVIQSTHTVQEVHHVQEVQEYGTTQGRKGHKLKRINMGFSDMNHHYITFESRRRGLSATAFVNQIIEEYRENN